MAKVISQETFDNIVKENIVEFSMTPEEAKDETVKQFEAQGVNLANIIKDLSINEETGIPLLNEAIENLKNHVSSENKLNVEKLKTNLEIIDSECKKSIPHRVLAAKNGTQEILLSILNDAFFNKNNITTMSTDTATNTIQTTTTAAYNDNYDIICRCLKAANSLINKQPDIFNEDALKIIIKILEIEKNTQILCLTLQWISKACIMHEINRQNIMNAKILKYLKPLLFLQNGKLLRDACTVIRYLILDDDIRVEFGKAHEHAKTISNEVLVDLTKLLSDYDDIDVLCDLILTIATLIVRHEYCVNVEEAGGLKIVLDLMSKYPDEAKLNRESLKLLRALAGHDTVKARIIQQGAAPIIRDLIAAHKENDSLVSAALSCISILTLRNQENKLEFFKVNLPEILVEILNMYPKNKIIQRNAAWAIRNMVSRLPEYCENFLILGVENLLNAALKEHPSIEHDIKSALRDLGCNVKLREEWTGKSEIKMLN